MNKDLDERLVPNGQYRDAMNIQVSTSEGSDVGTVQNILGNTSLFPSNTIAPGSKCVGAVADEKNDCFYWFIYYSSKNIILKYNENEISFVLVDTDNILNFDGNIITGINVIGDFLLWTDNYSEPKKIDVKLCQDGTDQRGFYHTHLIVPKRSITVSNCIKIREEHITVIKKSPKNKLVLDPTFAVRVTATTAYDFLDSDGNLMEVGEQGDIYFNDIFPSQEIYRTGDVILLTDANQQDLLPEVYEIKIQIIEELLLLDGFYRFKLLSISTAFDISASEYVCEKEFKNIIFPRKFVRFGYRYKFQDNQYSSFSTFTDVLFKPGDFEYNSKEAYNKAMENNLVSLKVRGFLSSETPEDVVQVDILYKESNSPTVYIVDKIKYNDIANVPVANGLKNNWNANYYEIKSDLIYAVVPENQLLRPWDNVPRKALAQEITGNRLVYANYLQNYDMNVKPILNGDYDSRYTNNTEYVINYNLNQINNAIPERRRLTSGFGQKSLKSLRNYQLGITYLDKYNRETPIFTSVESRFSIPKKHSKFKTKITGQVKTIAPSWAESFKVYIKETSTEYYNIAMHKVYRAEDGNLWLSFPSSERNKVDEETFLILKKAIDTDELVESLAKYKVLSIENNAPDYITTEKLSIFQKPCGGSAGIDLFGSYPPTVNSKTFRIVESNWLGTGAPDMSAITEPLLVTFKNTSDNEYTSTYEISKVEPPGNAASFYKITLEKVFETKDAELIYPDYPSITGGSGGLNINTNISIVVYKQKQVSYKAEFKGMFFVKISSDEVTETNILRYNNDDYEISHSIPVHHFLDSGNTFTNGGTGNNTTSAENLITLPNGNSFRTSNQEEWAGLLDFGGTGNALFPNNHNFSGDVIGGFFIDNAFYIDEQPGGGVSSGDSSDQQLEIGHCMEVVRRVRTEYQDAGNPNGTPDTWEGQIDNVFPWWQDKRYGTTNSYTQKFGKGIHSVGTDHYVEVSFSGIGQSVGSGQAIWNQDDPPYAKLQWGNSGDTGTFRPEFNEKAIRDYAQNYSGKPNELELIINNIKAGKRFKVRGDEDTNNVYTILGVNQIKRYNYDSPFRVYIEFTQWNKRFGDPQSLQTFKDGWDKFMLPENRRITYRIRLSHSLLDAKINNNIITHVDSADSSNNNSDIDKSVSFQFLEQRYTDDGAQEISKNPAIWETEPKETADLDIYYEASEALPLKINGKNAKTFIPIGSVVTCPGRKDVLHPTSVDYVVMIRGSLINLVHGVSLQALTGPPSFNLPSVPLHFTRPDNSYTTAYCDTNLTSALQADGTLRYNQLYIIPNVSQNPFALSWYNCYSFGNGVESNRIRDDFNQPMLDKGAKVSTVLEENYEEERRSSGLIFSGIYNTNSGVNNLNQFIQAEPITKDLNPTYGSIQKLYSKASVQGDLIAFCEDRVIKILANKDALFNADGNTNLISSTNVLGHAQPYSGGYGISTNPESFAHDKFRVYFTDKQRGAVLRLSADGLTPISEYGMSDYFKDTLKFCPVLTGSYDDKKGEYNITMPQVGVTVSYKEAIRGWSSFKSFVPDIGLSMANNYYTFKNALPYKHHVENDIANNKVDRNTFYGDYTPSSVDVLLNDASSTIKSYKTLTYEGSQSKVNIDDTVGTGYYNLTEKEGWSATSITTDKQSGYVPEFIEKEGKWFNNIKGLNIIAGQQDSNGNVENINLKTDEFAYQGIGKASMIEIDAALYPIIYGCTNSNAANYDSDATVDDSSCIFPRPQGPIVIGGCMDSDDRYYNIDATYDDGSCFFQCNPVAGCTDPNAINFNPNATEDDGSCIMPVPGCTDQYAINYDPNANINDGTCEYYTDSRDTGGGGSNNNNTGNTPITFTVQDTSDQDVIGTFPDSDSE